FNLKTSEDAVTGNWMVKARLGGNTFAKRLMIETVVPNRLKVDFGLKQKTIGSDGVVKGAIESQWLHGATASKLKTKINVRLATIKTQFDRFKDYVFDDPTRRANTHQQELFVGELDDNGKAAVDARFSGMAKEAAGVMNAYFTTQVFEPSGVASSAQQLFTYFPYQYFVGINTPKGDARRGMLLTDTEHEIAIGTVDQNGKPVSRNNIHATVYKVEWRWWWDQSGDRDLASFSSSSANIALFESNVTTDKNGQGAFKFKIDYPDWGRYLIRVCDRDSGHCSGKTVYIDWPGWAGRAQDDNGAGASVLNFQTDKPKYRVGEKAIVQLPDIAQGRALVTVETGSKVIDAQWREFKKGKTQSDLPITAQMVPNVYVNVTLSQPHAEPQNDRPIRLYGIVPVLVEDPGTLLTPVLKAADEWRPSTEVSVNVAESSGKPMTYTLAVVDEGLLGLTAFRTPSLHNEFYKREALGVTTWDLYDYVVGAYGGELERLLSLGGDRSEVDPENDSASKRFPPVVQVLGPFKLDAKKSQDHTITLPNYIGAVRVMLVAGEKGAYGSTDKTVLVRQPLSILPTMPRVLGPGEEFTVPVSVFVMNDDIKNVTLSTAVDQNFELVGAKSVDVAFKKPGDQLVLLKMRTRNTLGKGKVTFNAQSGSHSASSVIHIDVRSPNPRTTSTIEAVIEPGEQWSKFIKPTGLAGTNKVWTEVSSFYPLNMQRYLNYLIQYPHGCLEQTTSSVFPQLYLDSLVELPEYRKREVARNISKGIERLRTFQLPDGGFSYWPDGTADGNDNSYTGWASNYAGHFLLEAEKRGYHVPPQMLRGWLNYQRGLAQRWTDTGRDSQITQAYRLYVLALANEPELGAMNRMREAPGLDVLAAWQLAAAYKLAGQSGAAETLSRSLSIQTASYTSADGTFGSVIRDRSIILNAMINLGRSKEMLLVAKSISEELNRGSWLSTQSAAFALMSFGKLVQNDTAVEKF
ncbi:MAG: alpha-2-macroglobulin family protein, partial [Betaproteobacteria bacterium]